MFYCNDRFAKSLLITKIVFFALYVIINGHKLPKFFHIARWTGQSAITSSTGQWSEPKISLCIDADTSLSLRRLEVMK